MEENGSYILVQADRRQAEAVARGASKIRHVRSARAVLGAYDLIVEIESAAPEVPLAVMRRVGALAGVLRVVLLEPGRSSATEFTPTSPRRPRVRPEVHRPRHLRVVPSAS